MFDYRFYIFDSIINIKKLANAKSLEEVKDILKDCLDLEAERIYQEYEEGASLDYAHSKNCYNVDTVATVLK